MLTNWLWAHTSMIPQALHGVGEMRYLFAAIATLSLALNTMAAGQDGKGFARFEKEPSNAPGSYKVIADPTGSGPNSKVHSFTLTSSACSDSKYSSGRSDCFYNSIRTQAYEKGKKQPPDAWYSWWMYLDPAFPFGAAQKAGGFYSFAYWHNGNCPNLDIGIAEDSTKLTLKTNSFDGDTQCIPDQEITLANASSLRGSWHHFEVHIVWSNGKDGLAEVYIDGKKAGTINGRNITRNTLKQNYFKFGIYLHNTRATELIVSARAYFAGFSRAKSREALTP